MAERDKKGHFVQGNKEGNRFSSHDGTATEAAIKGNTSPKRAENRTMKERVKLLCSMPANELSKGNLRKSGYSEEFVESADKGLVIAAAQVMRAEGGDNKAAVWVMNALGETKDTQDINVNIGTRLDYALLKPKEDGSNNETI